jgi:hypothetical protein
MTNQSSESLLRLLEEWSATMPPAAVRIEREPDPHSEYEPSVAMRFRPKRQRECNLDITITDTGYCGLFVDSWSRLAARYGIGYSKPHPPAEDVIALYLEPRLLPAELVLAACKAVAAGEVHLEIGIVLNRIVGTRGFLRLPTGPFRMDGVGAPMVVSKMLEKAKLGAIQRVVYDPWF